MTDFGCPSAFADTTVLATINTQETTMGSLEQLTLVTAKKQVRLNPQQHRRNKLAAKIDEQINIAEAKLNGTTYQPTKRKTVINQQTGEMTSFETTKRLKEVVVDK